MAIMNNVPRIAITGSCGKTTTREFVAAILETKWKVLKTEGNCNLPGYIREAIRKFDSSYQAIVLELGMGKQGAGERHCQYMKPNVSIITNIGTAHYGNLGNNIESTAKFKSALITHMNQKGLLFLNYDDANSRLLKTSGFRGKIITVGMNEGADYRATNARFGTGGMRFKVNLNGRNESFYIPTLGMHSIYNALFAIAVAHQHQFTATEIRTGLSFYKIPDKRLNLHRLKEDSLLIDDTINANPQSMKAAIDVLAEISKKKKKIAILGTMLELGDYTRAGHKEVGHYLASKQIDTVYTYGPEAQAIGAGAFANGFPEEQIKHFNDRTSMHLALSKELGPNTVILVKGSSLTKMDETTKYLLYEYGLNMNSGVHYDNHTTLYMNERTLLEHNIHAEKVTLHYGALNTELVVQVNNKLLPGEVMFPHTLANGITIPGVKFDYYFKDGGLVIGPVIGMHAKLTYFLNPRKQLLRFSNYNRIKGLIYLFRLEDINISKKTIQGLYFCPKSSQFVTGTFPYPSAVFNRAPMTPEVYEHFREYIGDNIFNYPYGNVNKLQFYNEVASVEQNKKHLPYTLAYSKENFEHMLAAHNEIYLKPTSLAGGKGVLRISKRKDGLYLLSDTTGRHRRMKSIGSLIKNAERHMLRSKTYLIQQAIPYYNRHNNKIDFRVYFQRDKSKNWVYSGMETKVAKEGSIISNSSNRKEIVPGEVALRKIYGLTREEIKEKIVEITAISCRFLDTMKEKWVHLGDVAVDLVIDEHLKVWVLEIQIDYAAEIKGERQEDETRILHKILPTPFEYAKALTGF